MIKRIFTIVLFLAAFAGMAFADVQTGYVRTIKRPGKKVEYLDNVQISVKGISGSFRSKKNGRFELELQPLNLKVGAPFILSEIFKSGYELYDNNMSRVYSPGAPIEIVLRDIAQEAADRQKFADNMYKGALAKRDKKIKALDKQLKDGKITQEKYREELQRYNDVFEKYQADINTIAKRYAGLDYENIDPVTEAINMAFSNGDFELADSLLNTLGAIDAEMDANISARGSLGAKVDLGNAIIGEGDDELKHNLKDAERLAELAYAKHISFLNNYRNDSAAYYLEKRAALLPDNAGYQLAAGEFVMKYMVNYSLASDYFDRALVVARKQYGESHPEVASCYTNIGTLHYNLYEYDKALEYFRKALQINADAFGENHPDIATCYLNIGAVYCSKYEHAVALDFFEKALNIRLDIFGENHPDIAECYTWIGYINLDRGDYAEAMDIYDKALKIQLDILGENNSAVAATYVMLGCLYRYHDDYAKALENCEKALKIQSGIFGENHPITASGYHNIGVLYSDQGDYARALEYHEKALKIRLDIFGENHPDVASSYNSIGSIYCDRGEYDKAYGNFIKAWEIRMDIFGEHHPGVAECYNNIGMVCNRVQEYTMALAYYERALEIVKDIYGENHTLVATCYTNIGWVHSSQGENVKALEYFEKALKINLDLFGEDHPGVKSQRDDIEAIKASMETQED